MRRLLFIIVHIFIVALSLTLAGERNGEIEDLIINANQLYKEGNYSDAVERYSKAINLKHTNGHLYYNLGNAYFRMNQLGYAILNYERARLLMPRDADLDYNLRYVRQQARDMIEKRVGFFSSTFFWLRSVTLKEIFWIFVIINIAFWSILIFRLFYKQEWIYYLMIISLVTWIISGTSFACKYYVIQTDNRAVVIGEEVNVLSGPDAGDTILFKLHSGTIVNIERDEDGWKLVCLQDNKRGWIQTEFVESIRFN
ncbi:MAG: tetratricopeptide repeat protein [Spirochaetota bacterium]|nr:tetratricopeptide repeat protein [Spirochaetota bacterium]